VYFIQINIFWGLIVWFRRYTDIQNILQNRAVKEFTAHPNIILNNKWFFFVGELQQKYKDTKRSAVRDDKT
jgi:hypothetical protein